MRMLPVLSAGPLEDKLFQQTSARRAEDFQNAIQQGDLDRADLAWHDMAGDYIQAGFDLMQVRLPGRHDEYRRGRPPHFESRRIAAPAQPRWATGAQTLMGRAWATLGGRTASRLGRASKLLFLGNCASSITKNILKVLHHFISQS